MAKSDFINDCEVITITPMEVECVVINPSSSFLSDGSASISITGGTPPYNITWGNGGLGLAIYGLSVGEYPAVITDFYGDFTANTVCVLTAETPTREIISVYERCRGVGCFETDISFGEQTDPDVIVSNWVRFSNFAGVNYPGAGQSGLQINGTIITNDPNMYFYTGATNLNYLGTYGTTMQEGEDVAPVTAEESNEGKFYYNTYLNKFIVSFDVGGGAIYRWTTWNPTIDTGLAYGNPTATRFLTTSSNWSTSSLTNDNLTVSGVSNTVVTAIDKITDAGGVTKMIECSQNSGLMNGFYSTCGYNEYNHEVTLGSTAPDNDTIGLVLAAFKDEGGVYGPSGQTQTLYFMLNSQNNFARISFNQNNNTQSFTDGSGNFSTIVWESTSPFGTGNYDDKGQIRFKVIKTNTTISIYNTGRMGSGSGQIPIGSTNPYTLLVSIDLTDDSTWTDKPSYAVGDELERFTGGTQFGYLTASQKQTQFYDIVFSGSQQSNADTLYGLNVVNPGANNVSTFNEVPGCWEYIEDIIGYVGPSYSLSLDTGYSNCTQCQPPLEEFCITYQVVGRSQPRVQLNMVGNGYDNLGNPQWIADNTFNVCEVLYNPQNELWYLTCPINFTAGGTSGAGQLFSTDLLSSNPPIMEWFPLGVTLQTLIVSSGTCEESIAFLLDTSVSQPSCICDGQITLNPSGGQPPYEYSINNGVTYDNSNIYTELCPGIYSVSVKDSLGNIINDSITLNPLLPQTSYSVNLSTTTQVIVQSPDIYHRLFQTTLSVTPPLPVGVTIDADIVHTGIWANSRKPGYSDLVRTVDLTKNGTSISPFSGIMGSFLPASPQCGGINHTIQYITTTNTWSNVVIGNADNIIITTDSKLTFDIPANNGCDFGTDSNSFEISNLRINGCECCTVVNNNFIEP